MKLWEKLGAIGGGQCEKFQTSMEDFGTHGTFVSVKSLGTLTLGHELKVPYIELFENKQYIKVLPLGKFQSAENKSHTHRT